MVRTAIAVACLLAAGSVSADRIDAVLLAAFPAPPAQWQAVSDPVIDRPEGTAQRAYVRRYRHMDISATGDYDYRDVSLRISLDISHEIHHARNMLGFAERGVLPGAQLVEVDGEAAVLLVNPSASVVSAVMLVDERLVLEVSTAAADGESSVREFLPLWDFDALRLAAEM